MHHGNHGDHHSHHAYIFYRPHSRVSHAGITEVKVHYRTDTHTHTHNKGTDSCTSISGKGQKVCLTSFPHSVIARVLLTRIIGQPQLVYISTGDGQSGTM